MRSAGILIDAVQRVAAGGSALDPEVVARMVGRRRKDDPLDVLTAREREVLALMAEGKSNHRIAAQLGVSVAAAEKHASNIFGKLGVGAEQSEHRRVMAVLAQLRGGPPPAAQIGSVAVTRVPPVRGLSTASAPSSAARRSSRPRRPLPRSTSTPPGPSSATCTRSTWSAAVT